MAPEVTRKVECVQRVAIFNPPQATKAWRAWKAENAEALRQIPAEAIRVDVARHSGGESSVAVFVADEWLSVLAHVRER
jgi:hypothetical protein